MSTTQYLFAGFGGQGILFSGKFLAYKGLLEGKNVSWLPSYGPEMRGGTASCSVIASEEAVGSPIVSKPEALIAMNLPSLDRYENSVVPGGMIFVDSTLVERKILRSDVKAFYVPATRLASDNGLGNLANMIIMGKVLSETCGFDKEAAEMALKKVIPQKHADMFDMNIKAMEIGAGV